TSVVRDRIEAMILRGELAAGERLNEIALAAKLDVSRGPIREATRQLAEAGLLTVVHNRGAFVRQIKLEEVLHVYDVRAGLAHVSGKLAALRATRTQVAELRPYWQQMEDAISPTVTQASAPPTPASHGNDRRTDFPDEQL
ncbi:MAG: GntR family transcriptional regulator, partial [Verrucomicrobiales bacterium]